MLFPQLFFTACSTWASHCSRSFFQAFGGATAALLLFLLVPGVPELASFLLRAHAGLRLQGHGNAAAGSVSVPGRGWGDFSAPPPSCPFFSASPSALLCSRSWLQSLSALTPEPRERGAESNPAACYPRPVWQHRCTVAITNSTTSSLWDVPVLPSSPVPWQGVQPGVQLPAGVGCRPPLSPTVPSAALPARCRHTAGGGGVSTGERAPAGLPAGRQPRPQKRLCREAGARRSGSLPRGCGQQEEGTAGEEALPVSRDIYHCSLSCRSSCSSLSPLLLRATCPRMQVTTFRRAWSVRGERHLRQQGQSLPDSAAGTVLPLPTLSPASM